MREHLARAETAVLEAVLIVALVGVGVFGFLRTVFGPFALGSFLPDAVRDFGDRLFGPAFLGGLPFVRATLAPGVAVQTTPRLYQYGAEEVPAGRGEFSGPFEAQVNVFAPSPLQRLGLVGGDLVTVVATLAVVLLLWQMVRSLRRGDPFTVANARRLQLIAVAVAVGGTIGASLHSLGQFLVLQDPVISPFVADATFSIPLLPLADGLGIWLLGEVFRRGAAMRRELEGVV